MAQSLRTPCGSLRLWNLPQAYNLGHIGQAIAAAARMSADKGDYEDAVALLKPVLGGMYDNFLTDDPERPSWTSRDA